MNISLSPAGGWIVWTIAASLVIYLTYSAYRERLKPGGPFTRPARIGFSLRMIALLITLFAALRPTVVLTVKRERPALLLFQLDKSRSMSLSDEAAGRSRPARCHHYHIAHLRCLPDIARHGFGAGTGQRLWRGWC